VRKIAAAVAVVSTGVASLVGLGIAAISQIAAACPPTPVPSTAAPSGSTPSPSQAAPAASAGDGSSASASATDPAWPTFLAAVREQETGSAAGDYTENVAGCEGAYCWRDAGTWRSTAAAARVDVSAYPEAFRAPPTVQDMVVSAYLYPVYAAAGGGQAGYAAAAADWNGGTTSVRSNPALGPGATNYTYADEVLAKMASLAGASSPSPAASLSRCPAPAQAAAGYENPLRDVADLKPERIDQGVDYAGSGPIYALGPGVVRSVYDSGWPGGVFIAYELTGGPDAGHGVYVAENLVPEVSAGEQVNVNTVVATLRPQPPNLETGFADLQALGESEAMSDHQAASGGDAGTVSTWCGQAFDELLVSLGAPGGTLQAGSIPGTSCP
jgi:hypothetical protein